MLRLEKLMFALFREPLDDDIELLNEVDVESVDGDALVTFRLLGGPAINGGTGRPPTAWACELIVDVYSDDDDEVWRIAGFVYDLLHSFNDPFGGTNIVEDIGSASAVVDRSLFTRIFDGDAGTNRIIQLSGAFGLQLHQA